MQHPPLNPPSVKNSTVKKYCHNIYRHAHCGRHSLYFGEEIKYSALTPPIRGDKAGSQGAGKALSPRGLFTNCTTTRGLLGSLGWAVAPVTQSHMQCLNSQEGYRPLTPKPASPTPSMAQDSRAHAQLGGAPISSQRSPEQQRSKPHDNTELPRGNHRLWGPPASSSRSRTGWQPAAW